MSPPARDPFDPLARPIFDDDFVRAARYREVDAWNPDTLVASSPPPPPRRRRRKPRRPAATKPLVVLLVLAIGITAAQRSEILSAPDDAPAPQGAAASPGDSAPAAAVTDRGPDPHDSLGGPVAPLAPDGFDWPSPQPGSSAPLGTPQAAPPQAGPFVFAAHQPDSAKPVAYDPCRPLRYVVNNATAPPGADALVAAAVATMSSVTGLQFEAEGPTDEAPSSQRRVFQPDRYGDRWAPILIAWSDHVTVPELQGDIAGIGGSAFVQYPGAPSVYVTGEVVLDGPQLAQVLDRPDGHRRVQATILHELGHLLGLGHVDDPGQLMHAQSGQLELQSGDLAGLVQLGAGPCVPVV